MVRVTRHRHTLGDGYDRFYSTWHFDAEGRFLGVGHWEGEWEASNWGRVA